MSDTPRTDAEAMDGAFKDQGCTITLQQWDYYKTTDGEVVMVEFARQLERLLNMQRDALEAADECLSLIEDVGHGAMSDNVTVTRGIVLSALSQNYKLNGKHP